MDINGAEETHATFCAVRRTHQCAVRYEKSPGLAGGLLGQVCVFLPNVRPPAATLDHVRRSRAHSVGPCRPVAIVALDAHIDEAVTSPCSKTRVWPPPAHLKSVAYDSYSSGSYSDRDHAVSFKLSVTWHAMWHALPAHDRNGSQLSSCLLGSDPGRGRSSRGWPSQAERQRSLWRSRIMIFSY